MPIVLKTPATQRLTTISLLLLLNVTSVFALNCQKEDLNQMELNECSKKSLDEETKKINKLYNDYRNTLEDTQKKSLKEVQLLWIKYKDKKCEFESSFYSGGSIAPLVYSDCLKDETIKRANEFKEYLKN